MARMDRVPLGQRSPPYPPLRVRWTISRAKDRLLKYLWKMTIHTPPYSHTPYHAHGLGASNAHAYHQIRAVIGQFVN